jgi:hypothetical protein
MEMKQVLGRPNSRHGRRICAVRISGLWPRFPDGPFGPAIPRDFRQFDPMLVDQGAAQLTGMPGSDLGKRCRLDGLLRQQAGTIRGPKPLRRVLKLRLSLGF